MAFLIAHPVDDLFRAATILLATVAMATLPGVMLEHLKGWRPRVMAAAIVLLFIGQLWDTLDNLGESFIWHDTPLLFAASVLTLIYVVSRGAWQWWR